MATIRRFGVLMLVAGLLVCNTGCSRHYHFNLICEIRNADDGTPLEGVRVVFDRSGRTDELESLVELEVKSEPNGMIYYPFSVSSGPAEGESWLLMLKKDGFHPEVVEITPKVMPNGFGERHALALPVEVKLRPK